MTTNVTITTPLAAVCQFCRVYGRMLRCIVRRRVRPEFLTCLMPSTFDVTKCMRQRYHNETGYGSLTQNVTNFTKLVCMKIPIALPSPTLFKQQELVGFTVVMVFIILASLLVNGVIIGTFAVTPPLRKCTLNFFAINLAISDLLAALVLEPLWVALLWNHHYLFIWGNPFLDLKESRKVQEIWGLFDLLLLVTSLMNIAALSIERCCVVWLPHWYRSHITTSVTYRLLTIPWLYGIFTALLSWIVVRYRLIKFLFGYRLFLVLTGFGVPTLLIVASYVLIFFRVRYKPISNRKNDTTLALRILSIVLMFFVFWTPFFTWFLAAAATGNLQMESNYPVFAVLKMISYFNVLFDPFLYVIVRPPFRTAVRNIIRKGRLRLNDTELGRVSRIDSGPRTATFQVEPRR